VTWYLWHGGQSKSDDADIVCSAVEGAAMAESSATIAEYLHSCRGAVLAAPGRKLHIVIGNEVSTMAKGFLSFAFSFVATDKL
jgi:hypothetical protein